MSRARPAATRPRGKPPRKTADAGQAASKDRGREASRLERPRKRRSRATRARRPSSAPRKMAFALQEPPHPVASRRRPGPYAVFRPGLPSARGLSTGLAPARPPRGARRHGRPAPGGPGGGPAAARSAPEEGPRRRGRPRIPVTPRGKPRYLSGVRAPLPVLAAALLLGSSPCPRGSFLQGACPDDPDRFAPAAAPGEDWLHRDPDTGAAEASPCDGSTCDGAWVLVSCGETWCQSEWVGTYCIERTEVDAWAARTGYTLTCQGLDSGYPPNALRAVCCHSCE